MSTHIIGFRPPDEKFLKMKKIWDSCIDLDILVPDPVCEFFNDEEPDEAGVEVKISDAVDTYNRDMIEGYEVDLSRLPKDVKIIRFYNSF